MSQDIIAIYNLKVVRLKMFIIFGRPTIFCFLFFMRTFKTLILENPLCFWITDSSILYIFFIASKSHQTWVIEIIALQNL